MTTATSLYSLAERPTEIIVVRRETSRPLTLWERARVAILYGDTGPARVILAASASFYGIEALLQPQSFQKFPIYEVMLRRAPQWVWGCLFLLAGIGLWWRIVEDKIRPPWGLAINGLTFALYGSIWILRLMATRTFASGDAAELVLAVAALWCLYRTKHPRDAALHS